MASTRTKRPSWVPVVTGLIRKKDLVLVGKRPEGKNLAGKWEFPGGKIELGESPEFALQRELEEELGINSEIGDLKFASTHSYSETGIVLMFYNVYFWKGEPKKNYHSELRWIHPDELHTLDIPEANKNILDELIKILKE